MVVLCVDDDPDDLDLLEEVLREINPTAKVYCCQGSDEALDLTSKLTTLPDCIFLDVNMPKTNGFQLLERLKQRHGLKKTTIVMFSTSNSQALADDARRHGVTYLTKPDKYKMWVEKISEVLQQHQAK
jgi:CheY-like chemotaxis protein